MELTKAYTGVPDTVSSRCSACGLAPAGSAMFVTTPLRLVEVVELPLEVVVEDVLLPVLLRDGVGVGVGVGVLLRDGVGVGVGVGVLLLVGVGVGVGVLLLVGVGVGLLTAMGVNAA